jgi:Flp pilus assembly protein TadG
MKRQTARNNRGAATVEMALVLPLILLFAFACVDFGRVVHAYVVVSNAARCGAEHGSMHKFTTYTHPFWESQVRQAVEKEMQGLAGFTADELQTTLTTFTDADGLFRLDVEVQYPFQTVVRWPGVPSQITLNHRVAMRQIR